MYVDVAEMTHYAVERNEDGMICAGVVALLRKVSTMPGGYWGDLPWSADWHKAWTTAVGWRLTEAEAARELLIGTGDALFQALADYTNTDIDAAASIERAGDDLNGVPDRLRPYLREDVRDDGRYAIGTYRPGGNDRFDHGYRNGDGGIPFSPSPPGNKDLRGDVGSGPVDNYTGKPADGNDDQLWQAMKKWGNFLSAVEKEVRALDSSIPKFYTDYLLAGFRTRPVRIDRYGDELLVGYRAYDDMVAGLDRDNDRLQNSWTGDGGTSFQSFAIHTLRRHLADNCRAQINALGEMTKSAADALQRLRNGYAAAIYDHAPVIHDRYRDYDTVWEKALGGVMLSSIPGGASAAAERFIDAAAHLVMELDDITGQVPSIAGELARANNEAERVPDFDSEVHRPRAPEADDSPDGDAWRDPPRW